MSGEKVLELSELSFDELGINENLLRGIYGYGFEKPSIISFILSLIMERFSSE